MASVAYERRDDGWWVVGFECGELGPYDSQAAARADAMGVRAFYAREWRGKQRVLFTGLKCEAGQLDLFDGMDGTD